MSQPRDLAAALAASFAIRQRVKRLIRRYPASQLVPVLRRELDAVEPTLARAIRDGQVLAWLNSATRLVRALRIAPVRRAGALRPVPALTAGGKAPPPRLVFPDRPDDPRPLVRFPAIERAARFLENRIGFTQGEFDRLDEDARRVGFTVARTIGVETVEKIRDALAENVRAGGTLRDFRAAAAEALAVSALSPAQVETVYRTQVGRAYSAGQQDVLDHPIVADEFPYLEYVATHDGRVRPEHLAMEHLGLNGTGVYRRDDPVWRRFYPPWSWNCRCFVIPLSREDAAAKGVREAREWVRTGRPPANPEWVPPPPFDLPKGWVPTSRRLAAVV